LDTSLHWNELEIRLMRTVELFQHKPVIMKKAEQRLESLKTALAAELERHPDSCPPDADRVKGQIVRGENNKGFPFVSLDLPQWFTKETFFTFRTLFWWGHYLGFSLILKGGDFEGYVDRLARNRNRPEAEHLWLALCETPWEWELEAAHFQLLEEAGEGRLRAHAERTGYLKLLRSFSVDAAGFPQLDWAQAGLAAYRQMTHLIHS